MEYVNNAQGLYRHYFSQLGIFKFEIYDIGDITAHMIIDALNAWEERNGTI